MYLTEIQIAKVITLIQEDHLKRPVTQTLNLSRSAVNKVWIRYQMYGIARSLIHAAQKQLPQKKTV